MREWINAFRLHQIDTLEARSKFLEKKLEKVGVRVPRGTVLLTEGIAAQVSKSNQPNPSDVVDEESSSESEGEEKKDA